MGALAVLGGVARTACAVLLLVSAGSKIAPSGRRSMVSARGRLARAISPAPIWYGLAVVEAALACVAVALPGWRGLIGADAFLLVTGVLALLSIGETEACGCYGAASRKIAPPQRRWRGAFSIGAAAVAWVDWSPYHWNNGAQTLVIVAGVLLTVSVIAEVRLSVAPLIRWCRGMFVCAIPRRSDDVSVTVLLRLASRSQAHGVVKHLLPEQTGPASIWWKGLRWRLLSWDYC
jgi:hypothetical protein